MMKTPEQLKGAIRNLAKKKRNPCTGNLAGFYV